MVSDPLGSGFVASFARPGGNVTGFVNIEASLSGKWLELMHQIAPSVSRVALLFNPQSEPYAHFYLDTFHAGATALSVMAIEAPFHDAVEIESVMTNLGSNSDAGLIVMPGDFHSSASRIDLCARSSLSLTGDLPLSLLYLERRPAFLRH